MKTKTFLPALILTALTLAISVDGNTIFSDDFTDASATNAAWTRVDNSNFTVGIANGSLNLAVSQEAWRGSAELLRPLGDARTSEFTITYVQKSATQQPRFAGLMFCRESATSGYILLLEDDQIIVGRMFDVTNPEVIFSHRSRDVSQGDNKIAVSKRGSEFNIFLNDIFQGSFNNSLFDSGDVSFFLMPGATATFGEITMTNTFRAGEVPMTFADNFNDGLHVYWNDISSSGATVAVVNEALRMTAPQSSNLSAQIFVDFPMTEFDAQVDALFISGNQPYARPYGIILVGRLPGPTADSYTLRNVFLLIDNDRCIWTGIGGYTIVPTPYEFINSGESNLPNRLRVVREAGASGYDFYINGEKLPVDIPLADFTIVGIGLFAGNNTSVEFDNFTVTRSGDIPSSIRQPRQFTRSQNRVNTTRSQLNNSFYDLRGRRVYSANPTSRNTRRPVAAGMYVNEERKDVRLRRR